jgi:hypothetical protein
MKENSGLVKESEVDLLKARIGWEKVKLERVEHEANMKKIA